MSSQLFGLAAVLAIPLTVLLVATYSTWTGQIAFVNGERAGVDALQAPRRVLAAEVALGMANVSSDASPGSAARLRATRDQLLSIAAAGPDNGDIRESTAASWRVLASLSGSERSARAADQPSDVAAMTLSHLEDIGNASNLLQDPFLPTYYLSTAVVSTLPTIVDTTANLSRLAHDAVRRGAFPAEIRTRLIALATLLEHQTRLLSKHLGYATGRDGEPSLAAPIEDFLVRSVAGSARVRDIGEKLGRDSVIKPTMENIATTAAESVEAQFALWDEANVHLGSMLDTRARGLLARQRAASAAVAVVILIIVAMLFRTRRDIIARHEAEDALAHQAAHDPLTGLPNRRLLVDRLAQACNRAQRNGHAVAVLFVDLDDFKYINDRYGHSAGDDVLRAVADRIRRTVRAMDTPARLGGDEFAVVLEDLTTPADAHRVASALLMAFDEPVQSDSVRIALRTSIGIAIRADGDLTGEDLLRNADTAMYTAKRHGKATVAVFDAATDGAASEERTLMLDLDGAIQRAELAVHYQPIVNLATGEIRGIEALLRWDHPEAGSISPVRFIPFAERSGRIVPIGNWVIERACDQLSAWRERYPELDLFVTINVSAVQLTAPDLVDHLRTVIAEAGLPPSSVILEFTESSAISRGDETISRLAQLKELGVRLAIDDFGTGYSSLSYLTRLPVDVLKVDKEFVDRLEKDSGAAALMQKVIELGTALGFITVAEGIEESEQVTALRSFDCSLGQGYLFARPQPAVTVERLLSDQVTVARTCTALEVQK